MSDLNASLNRFSRLLENGNRTKPVNYCEFNTSGRK